MFFCMRCRVVYWLTQRQAQSIFGAAQRRGLIPDPAQRPCVDCGRPAVHNEHRDYLRPLDVEPTCHRCNLRRGPGIARGSIAHIELAA